jgi:DNA-binding IclR family transcriptional regulator
VTIPDSEPNPRHRPGKRVGIVDRAASILDCFSRATPELTLPQIATRLKLPKATAFRILTNLVHHGLLEHNATANVYTLGFGTLRIADVLLRSLEIRTIARPVMRTIRDALNETVVLSIRDGDARYNIDSVESTHAVGQTQQIGVPIPLYAGAASRALLAALSDEAVAAYLARADRIAFSPTTMIDDQRLKEEITRVRKRGVATSSGEFTAGGHAVACAILDQTGTAVGALHVSIPGARFTKALEKTCAEHVRNGAKRIAAALNAAHEPRSLED